MLAIRTRRPLRILALGVAVTLVHAWLLEGRLRPLGRGGAPTMPPLSRMVLVAGTAPPPSGDPQPVPAVPPAATRTEADIPPHRTISTGVAAPQPRAPAAPTAPAQPDDAVAASVHLPTVPADPAGVATLPPRTDAVRETTDPSSVAMTGPEAVPLLLDAPPGRPPPGSGSGESPDATPATPAQRAPGPVDGMRPPPSPAVPASAAARWDYRVSRGAAQGDGELQWTPQGIGYELRLKAVAPGAPTLDWVSRGQVGADGLAPDRMVERQRDRDTQAVNFQRDKGLISFSGPSRTEPLLPGAQDRLSWIVQLAAQARARGELQPGELLRFQVASPRGDVDEWRFTVQPAIERLISGQRVVLTPLLREPQRPHDLRVQLWLSRQFDQLPVGLAWTVEPDGIPLEMWLTALPVNY